ncbi:MAG: hypothetical protein AO394_06885 [Candidatus Fermentibacter daniensis]|jgi:hypothetical protein|nr:MAG: hypothetical protein AO394_06885 [Candidatus Fermentibacter daniensis]KZD17480.1 MAG: hypothetical protein AO395_01890 [Candidatus Fermentibacter daniensis]
MIEGEREDSMKTERTKYLPPVAFDVSGRAAAGRQPMGTCYNGTFLMAQISCSEGITPSTEPETCSPNGLAPSLGGCDYGHLAANNCLSGTSF